MALNYSSSKPTIPISITSRSHQSSLTSSLPFSLKPPNNSPSPFFHTSTSQFHDHQIFAPPTLSRRLFIPSVSGLFDALTGGGGGGGSGREALIAVRRGMVLFTQGDVAGSLAEFDRAIELDPRQKAYLWQRGLSLYYLDRFEEGAEQFRLDVAQNPNDTEESIWCFLCEAQLYGVDEARRRYLELWAEIHDLSCGKLTTCLEMVVIQKRLVAAFSRGQESEYFYASLYAGLYYESQLWGTGNCQPTQRERIALLEQRMDNMEAMAASLATLEQRVYDLEQTHGPTQGQDFEDVVTELRLEIEDLSGRVGVLTRAFGNAPSGGMEFTRARVPEPRAYGGARDAKKLDNFLFDMEQYFNVVKADAEETRISMATMYLSGDAKLWWWTKHDEIQRGLCTIETWEQLKHELKLQFFPENVEYNARRALRDLKHTSTIRDYVKEFSGLMLDIKDMSQKDRLFFFLEGLKPWARVELQKQRVQDLDHAQAATECLADYTEPKQRDSGSLRKSRGGGKCQGHGKPKSGGANTSTSKTHSGGGQWQQKSYGDKSKPDAAKVHMLAASQSPYGPMITWHLSPRFTVFVEIGAPVNKSGSSLVGLIWHCFI
ncbi:unnamed protein product [Camellia sinensis]